MKVLFSRADFDDVPCKYLAAYTGQLVDKAVELGYETVNLYNDALEDPYSQQPVNGGATTLDFEKYLNEKPDIVIGAGHGAKSLFTGQDLQVLLKVGVNDDMLSEKRTFLASCLTGLKLGPSAVAKTCPEFHGYQNDFVFNPHPDYVDKPFEDPWAKAQFESAMVTGFAVLAGMKPLEVYEATVERYNYWWDWWSQQNDPMADEVMTWINWNRMNFITITPEGIYKTERAKLDLKTLAVPVGVATLFFLLSKT